MLALVALTACRDPGAGAVPSPASRAIETPAAATGSATEVEPGRPSRRGPVREALAARLTEVGEITVRIEGTSADRSNHGSATVVTADGRALTAHHVVDDLAAKYEAVWPSGQRSAVEVLARDPVHDLAALKISGASGARFASLGRVPDRGSWVVCGGVPGSPSDRVPTRTTGTLLTDSHVFEPVTFSRTGEPTKTGRFAPTLQLDCAVAAGMSGGPLLDMEGSLVGIMIGVGVAARLDLSSEVSRRLGLAPPSAPTGRITTTPPRARFEQLDRERRFDRLHDASVFLSGGDFASAGGLAVGDRGLVLTVARVLFDSRGAPSPERATALRVDGHPDARCATVTHSGELALLKCSGLPPGVELGRSPGPVLADEIFAVAPGTMPTGVGFVTGTGRTPGTIQPRGMPFGCGTMRARHRATNPPVTVGEVFAHDADRFLAGAIVVDSAGSLIGVDVASVDPGINYAVPISSAMGRFPELAPTTAALSP